MLRYGHSGNAVASVVTVVVTFLIVGAAGVGGYYAFTQNKNATESISSTVVPETSSSTQPSSSSSAQPATSSTSTSSGSTSTSTGSTSTSSETEPSTTSYETQSSVTSTTTLFTTTETSMETSLTYATTLTESSTCTYSTSESQSGVLNILSGIFSSSMTKDLLGNFSQMSLRFYINSNLNESTLGNSSVVNVTELILGSYSVVGTKVINGSQFTLVNYTLDLSTNGTQSFGGSQNQTGTIYFNPAWNATLIVSGSNTITGALATSTAADLMVFFELSLLYSSIISAVQSDYQVMTEINQTTINLGNVTMDVTNYNVTIPASNSSSSTTSSNSDSNCGNSSVPQLNSTGYTIIQVGKLPGTNTTLVTLVDSYISSPATGTEISEYQLISLTIANTTTTTSGTSSTTSETSHTSMTTI